MTQVLVAGLDIAKDTLDVVVYRRGADRALARSHRFANAAAGWSQLAAYLARWAEQLGGARCAVYLEATGVYSEGVCHAFAQQAGTTVHRVPPGRIKHYLQAIGQPGKTDALDAGGIARFGAHHDWPCWVAPDPAVAALRQLVHRREELQQLRLRERNRVHADTYRHAPQAAVAASRQRLLAVLDAELDQIERAIRQGLRATRALAHAARHLRSIQGVGPQTTTVVLAEVGVCPPAAVKSLVAWAGLAPRPRESGSSVRGQAKISPCRRRLLRKVLYMAALAGVRHNPILRDYYARLLARGKPKKLALVACMRKLLHLIYGVLKHQRPFDLRLATAA